MKCVGLLALLILIQSASKFIQLPYREVDVKDSYHHEVENNGKVDDETPSTENAADDSSETQNVDFDHSDDTERVDTSETFNDQNGRGQEATVNVTSEPSEHLQSIDGIFDSTKFYDKFSTEIFPRICMDGMTESVIDIVGNYIGSFSSIHSTLSGLSESSTSSSAAAVLFTIVDTIAKVTGSTYSVLLFLWEVVPDVFNSISEVVSILEIQTGATQVLDTITDLQNQLMGAIQIVMDVEDFKFGIEKQVNNATLKIANSVKTLVNNLNFIADTTAKSIESVSSEAQEGVISLSLVTATSLVIIQSVFASIACSLSSLQHISATALNAILAYIGSTLSSIAGAIESTRGLETENMSVVIGSISETLASVTDDVNWSSQSIIESVLELDFSFSLGDLLDRSSEVLGDISTATANSIASIASSLNAISTTSSGMLAKVATGINLVYKGLSRVIGNDSIIVTILIRSLRSIFKNIANALNDVGPGIGAEAPDALIKSTESVQVSLMSLLSLLNGSVEGNVNIVEIVRDIGKSVQYFASAITSVTLTISEELDNVHVLVLETVLSLQLIFSAVLYITQWVLAAAVTIFNSVAESVDEIMLKLTIVITSSLDKLSVICSTIAMIQSDSLRSTFVKIVPFVEDFKQLITLSYTPISSNVFNIVFNIDNLLTGAPKPKQSPIPELRHNTTGTIPEILNKVTGKLISISPDLSSAVFSLSNSLKICSNSASPALSVICKLLTFVLTEFTKLSGTAFEFLSLVSDLLRETFIHLSDVLSKFTVLGDVSVSLKTSVTDIHSALLELIDTINDGSTNLDNLVDPIRDVAKTTQILLSTFSAIFDALSRANKDLAQNLFEVITNLPYIVATIVLIVQYVLGAAIAKVLVVFGSVPVHLQELALTLSTILQRITSITANITLALSGTDVNYGEIINMIFSPISELNLLVSSSLSVISQILANAKVSFDSTKKVVQ